MAGPFYIFSSMGDGKDSGKLLFKSLTSSNSTVTIIQDQDCITFSSAGGGGGSNAINKDRIVWGTNTGISSSYAGLFITEIPLAVENKSGYESIWGSSIWSVNPPAFLQPLQTSQYSIVVGGKCGSIWSDSQLILKDNILLGGYCNRINSISSIQSNNNVILGGCKNLICTSYNSVIIGGGGNRFSCETTQPATSCNSTILASGCVRLSYGSENSAIISSSFIGNTDNNSTYFCSKIQQTTIMSSGNIYTFDGNPYSDSIESSVPVNSSVISSNSVRISSKSNSLISTSGASILGSSSVACRNTFYNSIVSQSGGCIISSCLSSLISTDFGCIKGLNNDNTNTLKCFTRNLVSSSESSKMFFDNFGILNSSCVVNSSIIGGRDNCIGTKSYTFIPDFTLGMWRITKSNLILVGVTSSILSSQESSILRSVCSRIDLALNSTIISSFGSCIGQTISSSYIALQASIISSKNSIISNCGKRSSIISSGNSKICCSELASIIGSTNSLITGFPFVVQTNNSIISSSDSIIKHECFNNLCFGLSNVIISGKGNCIYYNNFSAILGGCCNRIYKGQLPSGGLIISGCCNKIGPSPSPERDNTIISGACNRISGKPRGNTIVGGYKNCITSQEIVNFATIAGGSNMCNRFNYTTMVRGLKFSGCSWVKGFTGATGTFSSSGTICVCNGLVVCII